MSRRPGPPRGGAGKADDGRASRRYHDRVAGVYDDSYKSNWWEYHDKLVWDFLKPLLPADRPAQAVDLGCGTGKWGQRLAKSGFAVTFIDASAKMIDRAEKRAAELNLKNCVFKVADICALPDLPAAAFHFAVALGDPFCLCASAAAAARELARLLAPGGTGVLSFDHRYGALGHYFESRTFAELEQFLRDGKTRWLTERDEEQFPITMFAADDIEKLCGHAGLELRDLIGLTVFPARKYPQLIADPEQQRQLLALEQRYCRKRELWARATHLLAAVRKPAAA